VYLGNVGLTAGNSSVPGGAADGIDTVENVFVVHPEPGTWSVAVEAAEINQDACPVGHPSICGPTPGGTPEADATFSLVVTGGTGAPSCTAPSADITATPNPARVGVAVQFHSEVSGGSGGPYAYSWDFDGDGAADSTEANPTHVYSRPFDGPAKLWVADGANCPVTAREPVIVTGPVLVYDSYVALTEVDGNGNDGIDPGETWELTVNLRNDGNEPAVGVSAHLIQDPASAVAVTLLQSASTYSDIAVGVSAPSHLAYRFRVDGSAPCGERISFNLAARSTNPASTYPTEVGVIRLLVGGTGPVVTVYYQDFESLRGWWSRPPGDPADWEIDIPGGLGGPIADPTNGYDGPHVLGSDLTGLGLAPGNYEAYEGGNTAIYFAPPFDFSGFLRLSVSYARWLNVGAGDRAAFEAAVGGEWQWHILYSSTDAADSSWTVDSFDISDFADGRAPVYFTFRIESDARDTASGWNIDGFKVRGVPIESCEPYAPVNLPGEALNLRVSKSSGLTLEWSADCGAATSYGVYRGDLRVGYDSIAAVPGACDVTGTSTTIPLGTGVAEFFLVVPHKDGGEGSYGRNSAGAERPPAAGGCYAQGAFAVCAP
jgi:PKD repeat protein